MEIVDLKSAEMESLFSAVSRLHMQEIRHGALPLFGEKFLTRLYCELSKADRTVVLGAVEDGKLAGYVAGCADIACSYASVFKNAAIPLGWMMMGNLCRPDLLRKLPCIMTYPFGRKKTAEGHPDGNAQKGRPELLAIVVDEKYRGKHIGRTLVNAFERYLLSCGLDGFYYVSTNAADDGSNAFYQKLGFTFRGVAPHHSLTLRMYGKRIPGGSFGS